MTKRLIFLTKKKQEKGKDNMTKKKVKRDKAKDKNSEKSNKKKKKVK